MRRLISVVLAAAMAVGGLGAFLSLLLFADHFRGLVLIASGFVGGVGVLWLVEEVKEWWQGA